MMSMAILLVTWRSCQKFGIRNGFYSKGMEINQAIEENLKSIVINGDFIMPQQMMECALEGLQPW